ncbi:MAG: phage tail tape measure protein [Pyrinomonadaceae bacterium]
MDTTDPNKKLDALEGRVRGLERLNNLAAKQFAQSGSANIDTRQMQDFVRLSKESARINEVNARSQARLAEETAKQVTQAKQSELRNFENAEKSKQKISEITVQNQARLNEELARRQTQQAKIGLKVFEDGEKSKQRIAEVTARSQAKQTEIAMRAMEAARRRDFQDAQRVAREKAALAVAKESKYGAGDIAGLVGTAISGSTAVAGVYAVIKAGVEYQQAMNMFQAVTSATAEQMKRASEVSIQLGNDVALPGKSAKDAADALTELGKAGMNAEQAMAAAKGTLLLSIAANIDAAQAAEITANSLNMFGLAATESGRVADLLAAAANASSAEITDVAASLQQAGSVFNNAKVPIETVVALIAEMANAGIKGSDAGTSLKTMLQRLQSPTNEAAAAMKGLNVDIYDQAGAMRPMRDIIAQFEKGLTGLSQEQKDTALNTIFGADAVRGATIIFAAGAEGLDRMSESVQRHNAAAELAQARSLGLGGAWENLKSQAETLGLTIFNSIAGTLTSTLLVVGSFIGLIGQYPATFAAAAVALGLFATAMNAVNIAASIQALIAYGSSLGSLVFIAQNVVRAMFGLQSAFIGLEATVAAFAGWAALIAIVAGVAYAIYNMETAIDKANAVTTEAIQANAQSLQMYKDLAVEAENMAAAASETSQAQTQNGDVHERLNAILGRLDPATQIYIKSLSDEKNQIAEVTDAIQTNIEIQQDLLKSKLDVAAAAVIQAQQDIKSKNDAIIARREEIKTFENSIKSAKEMQATTAQGSLVWEANQKTIELNRMHLNALAQQNLEAETKNKDLTKAFVDNNIKVIQNAQGLGYNTEQLKDYFTKAGRTTSEVELLTAATQKTEIAQNNLGTTLSGTTNEANQAAKAVFNLRQELNNLSSVNQKNIDVRTFNVISGAKDKADLIAQSKQAKEDLKNDIALVKQYKEYEKIATDIINPAEKSGGGGRSRAVKDTSGAVSQLKRETQELAKAERELEALRRGGGQLYDIKIRREGVEFEKKQLEEILKLRRDFNQNARASLPQSRADAEKELETLKRVQKVRDDVLNIQNDSIEAEDKLLTARLTATADIISAQTRSDQTYFDGIRNRRNAEAQLTADIVSEIRKRESATTESAKNAINAQAEAYREFLAEQTSQDYDRQKQLARVALRIGASFAENPIIEAADKLSKLTPDASPVSTRIDKTNDLLGQILIAVKPKTSTPGVSGSTVNPSFISPTSSVSMRNAPSSRAAEVLGSVLNNTDFDGQLWQIAQKVAAERGFDPQVAFAMLKATLYRESSGKPNKTSEKGAGGWFQILPDTAARLGVKNVNDFGQAGTGALNELINGFQRGGIGEAFAGYFAGGGGGNRGTKTRNYKRDQSWVFNQAMQQWMQNPAATDTTAATTQTETFIPNTSKRPRIAGVNPIGVNIQSMREQFFPDFRLSGDKAGNNPIISDESFKNLTEYYELLDKFTTKEGEKQSLGEREAAGQSRLARFRDVQIEQIKELAILEEKLNALRSGDDVARTEVLQNAEIDRRRQLGGIISENIVLEDRLRNGGRDREMETAQLQNERLNILNSVGAAEASLERVRAINADKELRRAQQKASVVTEQANLETRLAQIENERATGGVNQALRVRVAVEEKLLELHNADFDAQVKLASLQTEMANKSNYSQVQANVKVLQHINQNIRSTTDAIANFKIALADGYFKAIDAPFDALQKRLEGLPPIIRDIASAFIDLARDIVKAFSQKIIMQLLGLGSGSGSGSGGGGGFSLGNIFNSIKGIFSGGGSSGSGSGGANGGFSGASSVFSSAGDVGGLLSRARIFTGGGSSSSAAHSGSPPPGGGIGLGGGIAIASMAATLIGGLIGGRVGNVISSIGSGAGMGAAIGSIVPGIGTAIGAGIGAVGGLIMGLLGGDPKRKIDKKENMPKLQQGFSDAFKQLKDLANDKNALFGDPDGTLAKAMELRASIASGFGIKFESKKYRGVAKTQIAQKLAEADEIIKNIREMSDTARTALNIDSRLETSFASGVYMDSGFRKQYGDFKRRNGRLPGAFTGKDYLPSLLADGELVLNERQRLDVINITGFDPFSHARIPNYASGTFVTSAPSAPSVPTPSRTTTTATATAGSSSGETKQPIIVKIYQTNNGIVESDIKEVLLESLGDSDVQVEVVESYDRGKSRKRN